MNSKICKKGSTFYLFLWILCFPILNVDGQHIEYLYDGAGNRIKRQVITIKTSKFSSGAITKEGNRQDKEESEVLDILGSYKMTIYPNPTKGDLYVNIHGGEKSSFSYAVSNMSGGKVLEGIITEKDQFVIPTSRIKSGIYILTIVFNGNNRKTYKIIKQ